MLATSQPSQPRYCLLDMPKPTVCLVLKSLSHLQRLKFTKYAKHNVKTNLIMTKFDCIQLFEPCIEQQMWFLANSQWLVTKQRRRHVTDKWPRGQQVIHLNTYQHENSNSDKIWNSEQGQIWHTAADTDLCLCTKSRPDQFILLSLGTWDRPCMFQHLLNVK